MGCRSVGKLSSNWLMNGGRLDFSASSREKPLTCDVVGTLPVSSSQNMASGSISVPDGPLGNSFWQSLMVRPWKRMPSFGSRTEPSQIMALRPLCDIRSVAGGVAGWWEKIGIPHTANCILDFHFPNLVARMALHFSQ